MYKWRHGQTALSCENAYGLCKPLTGLLISHSRPLWFHDDTSSSYALRLVPWRTKSARLRRMPRRTTEPRLRLATAVTEIHHRPSAIGFRLSVTNVHIALNRRSFARLRARFDSKSRQSANDNDTKEWL